MRVWLTVTGESGFLAAAFRADVLDGLAELGAAAADLPPSGVVGARVVSDIACCAARSNSRATCPTGCLTCSGTGPESSAMAGAYVGLDGAGRRAGHRPRQYPARLCSSCRSVCSAIMLDIACPSGEDLGRRGRLPRIR